MNKEKFNKLSVINQLEYVNKLLKEDKSLRSISGDLTISKSTIRNRFKKIGYMFNIDKKQYIKEDYYKTTTEVVKKQIQSNIIDNKEKNYNCSVSVVNEFDAYKNDLLELIQLKDDIKELLQKQHKNIIDVDPLELKIDTNILNGDAVNRSVKMYNSVYNELKDLYKLYPEFKKYDLLSQAIHEFYLKYKK